MYIHWWAGEGLARETSYLHSTAQPGGGAAVFLHCAYTTSDDAFVHSIVVNSPRQCGSGTATNGATENCLFHTCIVVNSPRQCRSGTATNGTTENAAGFSESLIAHVNVPVYVYM